MVGRRVQVAALVLFLILTPVWAQANISSLVGPNNASGYGREAPGSVAQSPTQLRTTGNFSFLDNFDYAQITELQEAGWTLCGGGAPSSYYSVSNGILSLGNDGNVGAAVCWNDIPTGVSDWAISTKVSGLGWESLQLVASTSAHTYRWSADGYYREFYLYRDDVEVREGGLYQPEWGSLQHLLGIEMRDRVVTVFFDLLPIASYSESSTNTNLSSLILASAWQTTNNFDYVRVSQIDLNAPDFSLTVTPTAQDVFTSENATFTIKISSQHSFRGTVTITASISPSLYQGPALSLNPANVTVPAGGIVESRLTASTSLYTPIGYDYAIRIYAQSGTISHLTQATLTVVTGGGTFTMSIVPHDITMYQKGAGEWTVTNATITLTSYGGYTGWASFTTSIQFAPGPLVSVTPDVVLLPPDGTVSVVMSVGGPSSQTETENLIQIWATISSFYQYAQVNVRFEHSYFTVGFDGTPILFPGSNSTINIVLYSYNNFSGPVTLHAEIDPYLAQWVSLSFQPTTVDLTANTFQVAVMTVYVATGFTGGSYSIIVRGVGTSWNAFTYVTLYIAPRAYTPGVHPGIWASYDVVANNIVATVRLTITDVHGNNINYTIEVYSAGGLVGSNTTWTNVATGLNPSPVIPFFLVAADLAIGDSIYESDQFRPITIQSSLFQVLAGSRRPSVGVQNSNPTSPTGITVWWDKATGILGQLDATVFIEDQYVTAHYKLVDTNAWPRLAATFTVSTSKGTAPLTVHFNSQVSSGSPPYTFNWNFGDGSTSTQKDPTHTFGSGTYIVVVTITDSNGDTVSKSATITATSSLPVPPVANTRIPSTILSILPRLPSLRTLVMIFGLIWLGLIGAVVVIVIRTRMRDRSTPDPA